MSDRVNVTSADFIRNIGFWQSEALRRPIVITHHGRERLVLAAPDNFNTTPSSAANADHDCEAKVLKANHDSVIDHLEEGMLMLDANLSVTLANRAALEFCGRDAESMRAPLVETVPQPLASLIQDRAQRVLRTRKSETFEASTFDGRQLAVRVFPLTAGAGVLFHNLTETVILRRRLEEDDALAAALRGHSQAATIKLDARSRIDGISDSFCKLSGFGASDLVGHRFVDLVSPQHRRETGELLERVLRERAIGEIVLVLLGRRGEEYSGRLAAAPILTDYVAQGVMAVWTPAAAESGMVSAA